MNPASWVEVGERCWVRRYPEWDVNVGVVGGSDGLLVIDTRGSLRQGDALRADVRRLGPQPVRHVVNTHVHFDHTFGNAAFAADVGDRIYAHANAAAALPADSERIKRLCRDNPDEDRDHPEISAQTLRDVIDTPIAVPARTFLRDETVEVGGRAVHLHHLGRGHTDGDVVAVVEGGSVVFAGDLIEQAAPPSFGADSFPLEWPATLAALLSLVDDSAAVVPGHGTAVRRDFVLAQAADVGAVASTIREFHGSGASLQDALAHPDWPYPRDWLADAIRRGYAALDGNR